MENKAWHDWRRRGIGASDAPIIQGVSPYTTLRELWRQKKGLPPLKEKSTFIMDRGNLLEPIARSRYELMYGIEMKPENFEHADPAFNIFRCSMDGSNRALRRGLEIKYVGQKDWEGICAGIVPGRYVPQIQHQFFVTGFDEIDFFAYFLPAEYAKDPSLFHLGRSHRIVCKPDVPYIVEYVDRALAFWDIVLHGDEPADPVKKKRGKKLSE